MAAEERGNTSETKKVSAVMNSNTNYKYKCNKNTIRKAKVDPEKEEEGELGAAVRRALGDGSKEKTDEGSFQQSYHKQMHIPI